MKGGLPTYHKVWADTPRLTFQQRVDKVVRLLSLREDERPKLVGLLRGIRP